VTFRFSVGSLFSGAGGLDMAVEQEFCGQLEWQSEVDPAASRVLAHHWPGVPNLGDITRIDWRKVAPVDVLCGGFPCQDLSLAGKRAGLSGSRSGLWRYMHKAAEILEPSVVIVENVLGLAASGAIDDVTADLVNLGYEVVWTVTSAASVGAPHRRRRVFIMARKSETPTVRRVPGDDGAPSGTKLFPTPEAKNAHAGQDFARADRPNSGGDDLVTALVKEALLCTPTASDGTGGKLSRSGARINEPLLGGQAREMASGWGKYATAIRRWESLTRPAPRPTEPTSTGAPRLNPAFSEWMMGWPAGWVTDVPGDQDALFGEPENAICRADQLKICGNGVVTKQAQSAIRLLADCDVVAK